MYPGVGAAGALRKRSLAAHTLDGRGQFTLDGLKARLYLPAVKVRAVVCEHELPSLHIWRSYPGWKQVHTQPEDSAVRKCCWDIYFFCRSQTGPARAQAKLCGNVLRRSNVRTTRRYSRSARFESSAWSH